MDPANDQPGGGRYIPPHLSAEGSTESQEAVESSYSSNVSLNVQQSSSDDVFARVVQDADSQFGESTGSAEIESHGLPRRAQSHRELRQLVSRPSLEWRAASFDPDAPPALHAVRHRRAHSHLSTLSSETETTTERQSVSKPSSSGPLFGLDAGALPLGLESDHAPSRNAPEGKIHIEAAGGSAPAGGSSTLPVIADGRAAEEQQEEVGSGTPVGRAAVSPQEVESPAVSAEGEGAASADPGVSPKPREPKRRRSCRQARPKCRAVQRATPPLPYNVSDLRHFLDPPHYFTKPWLVCLSVYALVLLAIYVASLCLACDSFVLDQALGSSAYFVYFVDVAAILALVTWMVMGVYLYRTQKFLSLPVKLSLAVPLLLLHVMNISFSTIASSQESAAVDATAKTLLLLMNTGYYIVYITVMFFLISQLLANYSES